LWLLRPEGKGGRAGAELVWRPNHGSPNSGSKVACTRWHRFVYDQATTIRQQLLAVLKRITRTDVSPNEHRANRQSIIRIPRRSLSRGQSRAEQAWSGVAVNVMEAPKIQAPKLCLLAMKLRLRDEDTSEFVTNQTNIWALFGSCARFLARLF